MPNRSDPFLVIAVLSVQCTIEVDSESKTRRYRSGADFTVEFDYTPGYNPSATAFHAYAFIGTDQNSNAMAQSQRSAAQQVIEEEDDESADGADALTGITAANYSTLTSFNSETFSPSVPGSGSSIEIGNYLAVLPNVTVVTNFWGLLCVIQDTLNDPPQ
jgi:hypothetical protein